MSYRTLCGLTGAIALALALTLLLAPQVIYALFAIAPHESADFLARRAAMLFVGFAVLSFSMREAEPRSQRSYSVAMATTMGALAALGSFELARGFAGLGLGLAIGVELFLTAAFVLHVRALSRPAPSPSSSS